MLRVNDIDVTYGDLQVLHGMSLSVEDGEIVALVGANAAGKLYRTHLSRQFSSEFLLGS